MWAIGKKEKCVVKESIGNNIGKVLGWCCFFKQSHRLKCLYSQNFQGVSKFYSFYD